MTPTDIHQRFVDHIGKELFKPGMRYHGSQSMLTMAFKPEQAKPLLDRLRSLLDTAFKKRAFLVYSYVQKSGKIEMICVHRIA